MTLPSYMIYIYQSHKNLSYKRRQKMWKKKAKTKAKLTWLYDTKHTTTTKTARGECE